MKSKQTVFLVCIGLLTVSLVAGCQWDTAQTSAAPLTWAPVLEVRGSASKQTDLFEIRGQKWRIRWQKPTPESHLSIYLRDKDGKTINIILSNEMTSDESYIHTRGLFSLETNATGPYIVTVEDWR